MGETTRVDGGGISVPVVVGNVVLVGTAVYVTLGIDKVGGTIGMSVGLLFCATRIADVERVTLRPCCPNGPMRKPPPITSRIAISMSIPYPKNPVQMLGLARRYRDNSLAVYLWGLLSASVSVKQRGDTVVVENSVAAWDVKPPDVGSHARCLLARRGRKWDQRLDREQTGWETASLVLDADAPRCNSRHIPAAHAASAVD